MVGMGCGNVGLKRDVDVIFFPLAEGECLGLRTWICIKSRWIMQFICICPCHNRNNSGLCSNVVCEFMFAAYLAENLKGFLAHFESSIRCVIADKLQRLSSAAWLCLCRLFAAAEGIEETHADQIDRNGFWLAKF